MGDASQAALAGAAQPNVQMLQMMQHASDAAIGARCRAWREAVAAGADEWAGRIRTELAVGGVTLHDDTGMWTAAGGRAGELPPPPLAPPPAHAERVYMLFHDKLFL